jgi:hypothetical protein
LAHGLTPRTASKLMLYPSFGCTCFGLFLGIDQESTNSWRLCLEV